MSKKRKIIIEADECKKIKKKHGEIIDIIEKSLEMDFRQINNEILDYFTTGDLKYKDYYFRNREIYILEHWRRAIKNAVNLSNIYQHLK